MEASKKDIASQPTTGTALPEVMKTDMDRAEVISATIVVYQALISV